jgi:hypothetical protein
MEGSCQLLPTASEESLLLLLDTLTSAIKVNIITNVICRMAYCKLLTHDYLRSIKKSLPVTSLFLYPHCSKSGRTIPQTLCSPVMSWICSMTWPRTRLCTLAYAVEYCHICVKYSSVASKRCLCLPYVLPFQSVPWLLPCANKIYCSLLLIW